MNCCIELIRLRLGAHWSRTLRTPPPRQRLVFFGDELRDGKSDRLFIPSEQVVGKQGRSANAEGKDAGTCLRESMMNGSEGSLPSGRRPNSFRESLLTVLGKLVVWRRTRYATTPFSQPEILRGILSVRKYTLSGNGIKKSIPFPEKCCPSTSHFHYI